MLFGILIGVFCVTLGISIILKTFFKIDIPIAKPFWAGVLIWFGLALIVDSLFYKHAYITINVEKENRKFK